MICLPRQLYRPFYRLRPLVLLACVLTSNALAAPTPQGSLSEHVQLDSLFHESQPQPAESNAHFYNLSSHEIALILADADNRVDQSFHIPPLLQPHVGFWFKIYAKFSSYQIVLFDKDHPDIIYAIQDDRDLLKRGLGPIGIEITSKARVTRMLSAYRGAIQQLIHNPNIQFKNDSAGSRILQLHGRHRSGEWHKIYSNLKTQRGQRDYIMRGVQASQPFMKPMEEIFKSYGLPPELTRIPLLESSFQIMAHSKASAVGVWQFLIKSGREYLTIDTNAGVDERLSPIKAAHAAAKMLKRNIRILKDVALAIIAYNHGAKNLVKLHKHYRGDKIVKLLDPANQGSPLGFASRSYYAEFLAILYAEVYSDKIYGLAKNSYDYSVSIIKLNKPATMYEIAVAHNTNLGDLRQFNPDVFSITKPLPKGLSVVIPRRVESASIFFSHARKPSASIELIE